MSDVSTLGLTTQQQQEGVTPDQQPTSTPNPLPILAPPILGPWDDGRMGRRGRVRGDLGDRRGMLQSVLSDEEVPHVGLEVGDRPGPDGGVDDRSRLVFRWIACGVEDTPDGPQAIGYTALNPGTIDGVVDLEPDPSVWLDPPRNSRGEVVLGHLAQRRPEGWVAPDLDEGGTGGGCA